MRDNRRFVLLLMGIVLLMGFAGNAYGYDLPTNRTIDWSNAGVNGGIPDRVAIFSTLSPSGGDDTSAIQTAIDNCPSGQVVLLNAGNFQITSISMKSGVTLRGSGVGVTMLVETVAGGAVISFGSGSYGTGVNLSGDLSKGNESIMTAINHGWDAGDIIIIDQIQEGAGGDPPNSNVGGDGTCGWCGRDSGTRNMGQLVELTAASDNTATLDMPLYLDYKSSQTPQGTKLTYGVAFSGIEALTIDNHNTMSANQNEQGTVNMDGAVNCWIKDVEIYGAKRIGVNLQRAYRNTLHQVSIHNTLFYTSNNGYAVWLRNGASANLVESCLFYDLTTGPIMNGPTSGNVFAYNYTTNIQSTDYPNANRGSVIMHGAHPTMNLIEGNFNDGNFMTADTYWGSSSHNTYFRNRIKPDSAKTAQLMSVAIDNMSYYYNIVGNILGDDRASIYTGNSVPYPGDPIGIFVFEWSGNDETFETSLIHGNYDYYHDAQTACDNANNPGCQGGPSDLDLSDSLYLSSKPDWWCQESAWPPIDPATNTASDIPAKRKYDGSICTAEAPINECNNELDDDGDGQIDLSDSGCSSLTDDDETNCGDGVAEDNEACDDGNTADGDGCSSSCRNEEDGNNDSGGGGDGCYINAIGFISAVR